MIIEIYREGDSHPDVYDIFLTRTGKQVTLEPPPDYLGDTLQVVLERGGFTPNPAQLAVLFKARTAMNAKLAVL